MSKSTRRGRVLATFNDAGTGETFEAGSEHDFQAGAYGNYEAAGLVRPARPPRRQSATAA
jgi:hypothetical protein